MNQSEKIILAVLGFLVLLTGFLSLNNLYISNTNPVPSDGGTYREAIIGQPRYINPLLATSATDQSIINLVFSGLYTYDAEGKLIPDLATDLPEVNDEQNIYTVRLKENGSWHDNTPVTADDVLFTIKTVQDPSYKSPLRSVWQNTKVTKVDDTTITFELEDVSGPFIHNLTLPIISKQIWEQVSPDEFVLSPGNIEAIGNGPYRIQEVRKVAQGGIQSITLQSFLEHHNPHAFIETITLNFFENVEGVLTAIHGKQIDGFGYSTLEESLQISEQSNKLNITDIPLPEYQAAFFNLNRTLFQDKDVRKALLLAANVEPIIEEVYKGKGRALNGPILPEQVATLPEYNNTFDLQAAKDLLDEAGWEVDEETGIRNNGKFDLKIQLATNNFTLNAESAERLAAQWRAVGVDVSLHIIPTRELTDTVIRPREFDVLLFAQKLGADPDPFIFWHSSQAKNPGLNLSGYTNTITDKLISEARVLTDPVLRHDKYRQVHEQLIEDVPAIFLVQNTYSYAINKEVKGVETSVLYNQSLRFKHTPRWFINERRTFR